MDIYAVVFYVEFCIVYNGGEYVDHFMDLGKFGVEVVVHWFSYTG